MKTIESHDLARTIILTLERLALVLTDEVDSEEAKTLPDCEHHAQVPIAGQGQELLFIISASSGFMLEFTASLLGLETEQVDLAVLGPSSLEDLASVLTAELVPLLGASAAEIRLGPTRVLSSEELGSVVPARAPDCSCSLDAGGEHLRFLLYHDKRG
ncbi:MAG: hypothetical protein ACE5F1_12090 [Planctomycetota bacterium]